MTPSMESTLSAPSGLGHVRAPGVVVALERPHGGGDLGGLLVGVAGHDGGDGAGERAAFIRVVRQAVAHDERAQVRVAQAQGAEDVGVLGDFLRSGSWRCPPGFPGP